MSFHRGIPSDSVNRKSANVVSCAGGEARDDGWNVYIVSSTRNLAVGRERKNVQRHPPPQFEKHTKLNFFIT